MNAKTERPKTKTSPTEEPAINIDIGERGGGHREKTVVKFVAGLPDSTPENVEWCRISMTKNTDEPPNYVFTFPLFLAIGRLPTTADDCRTTATGKTCMK